MISWKCELELTSKREIIAGSETQLWYAIRKGADLRIETKFYHDEHIDVTSDNHELIIEVSEFRETLLINNCWAAGIMTLRQPVSLPKSFGPRPSMSFFMYNQNGQQAFARPYLDGWSQMDIQAKSPHEGFLDMPKYHQLDFWDAGTNAVCSNFIYDFESYRFFVNDCWEEVYSNTADGSAVKGSIDVLADALTAGCEVKAGIRGICSDLADESTP